MENNLACLLNGHRPNAGGDISAGVAARLFNTKWTFQRAHCLYCKESLYYVGDIMSDPSTSWKTKSEMDSTNDTPTGFDPDYD